MTAITRPTMTYAKAIFQLNTLANRSTEAKSTSGEDIRNEKVTPTGKPACVNPMKIGIEEQEQKGVIVPRSAAMIFAPNPLKRPKSFLVRSGGKYDWMNEERNIKTDSKINILITS